MLDSQGKKVVSLLFAVIILLSCVVVYQFVEPEEVKGEEHQVLGLSVSPFGGTFKLGVNQTKTFTASALNGTGPYDFSWFIYPSEDSDFYLTVNGEKCHVNDYINYMKIDGESLTLCFPEATEDFVSIVLSGVDANGLQGHSESFIVADPYTSSGYYFDGSQAVYSYKVSSDGLGWYRVFRGSDGSAQTSYDGTNSTTVVETLLGDMTSGALFLDGVAFDLDSLSVIPEDVRVICLYEDEYWEYINSADSSGSPYTVSVGSGVNNGYYLAQDSEGRICYVDTDSSILGQAIIDVVEASGDARTIYFNSGTYGSVAKPFGVEISKPMHIVGEAKGSPSYASPYYVGAFFYGGVTKPIFNILAGAKDVVVENIFVSNDDVYPSIKMGDLTDGKAEHITLRHITSRWSQGTIIDFVGYDLTLENLDFVTNSASVGVSLIELNGEEADRSRIVDMQHCKIRQTQGSPLTINSTDQVQISHCYFESNDYPIYVFDSSSLTFRHCWLELNSKTESLANVVFNDSTANPQVGLTFDTCNFGVNSYDFSVLFDCPLNPWEHIVFKHNVFGTSSGVTPYANLTDIADGEVTLIGNSFWTSASSWTNPSAIGLAITDDTFTSSNSGNATGTGSEQAIAHGCSFTPTYNQVILSERSTGGALAYQSSAPNATHIHITATNEKDFTWQVKMTP